MKDVKEIKPKGELGKDVFCLLIPHSCQSPSSSGEYFKRHLPHIGRRAYLIPKGKNRDLSNPKTEVQVFRVRSKEIFAVESAL